MNEKLILESKSVPLEEPAIYQGKNKTFIVVPVFQADGRETLGTILLRLMQKDVKNP